MANTMGKGRERNPMQIFFPNGRAEAKNTDPNNTGVYCRCQWPRERTTIYLYRFKLTDNPMCPCDEGEQSVEHLIHACRILEPQRSSLIQHITTRGGTWPPTNNKLVAKYLNAFSRFVKFIDFSKL
jgi:hypothetical protein